MFGAILKASNNSFQKGMKFCPSIYVKKVMKLLAFIFEQPLYVRPTRLDHPVHTHSLITAFASRMNSI